MQHLLHHQLLLQPPLTLMVWVKGKRCSPVPLTDQALCLNHQYSQVSTRSGQKKEFQRVQSRLWCTHNSCFIQIWSNILDSPGCTKELAVVTLPHFCCFYWCLTACNFCVEALKRFCLSSDQTQTWLTFCLKPMKTGSGVSLSCSYLPLSAVDISTADMMHTPLITAWSFVTLTV